MIVVNLWGAPSSGKSTGASYIFSQLKLKGYNVELVTEFAKDLTWEENDKALSNQFYVSGCQANRLSRLKDKVDIVITDSPLPIGILYFNDSTPPHLRNAIMEEFDKYENINFFIGRTKPYNPIGRNQTKEESEEIACHIADLLAMEQIKFTKVGGNQCGYDYIVKYIEELLSVSNENQE